MVLCFVLIHLWKALNASSALALNVGLILQTTSPPVMCSKHILCSALSDIQRFLSSKLLGVFLDYAQLRGLPRPLRELHVDLGAPPFFCRSPHLLSLPLWEPWTLPTDFSTPSCCAFLLESSPPCIVCGLGRGPRGKAVAIGTSPREGSVAALMYPITVSACLGWLCFLQ